MRIKDWQTKASYQKIKTVTVAFLTVLEFKALLAELAVTASERKQNYEGFIARIEENSDVNNALYHKIFQILKNYDQELSSVLEHHRGDFIEAYKLHMQKIEKELSVLRNRHSEQDSKASHDGKVVGLEKSLAWFKFEFDSLLEIKKKNETTLNMIDTDVQDL